MKNFTIALGIALIAAFGVGCFQVGGMYRELLQYRQDDAIHKSLFSDGDTSVKAMLPHSMLKGKK